VSVRESIFDGDVSPLDVAEFAQPLLERLNAGIEPRENKVSDPRNLLRLLRAGWKAKRKEHNATEAKRTANSAKRTAHHFFLINLLYAFAAPCSPNTCHLATFLYVRLFFSNPKSKIENPKLFYDPVRPHQHFRSDR
jgi:hypothetical protein